MLGRDSPVSASAAARARVCDSFVYNRWGKEASSATLILRTRFKIQCDRERRRRSVVGKRRYPEDESSSMVLILSVDKSAPQSIRVAQIAS